jgi:hypothetical protein
MKFILSENQLKLLNEVKGFAVPTIPYINMTYNVIEEYFYVMLAEQKSQKEEIIIDLHEIIPLAKNNLDDFIDFPIEEIFIDFKFTASKKEMGADGKTYSSGGGAYAITEDEDKEDGSYLVEPSSELPLKVLKEVDKVLRAKFDFEVIIYRNFDESEIDEILFDLRDTITHEYNHLYEFYKKWENMGERKMTLSKSFAGSQNVNTPKKIFRKYEEFLYMMYYSEPWEINANVQEALSKVLRMSFEEFKNTKQWEWANKMESFDANRFYDELVSITNERSPEAVDYHIRNLHKFYLKQHYEYDLAYLGDEAKSLNDDVYKTKNLLDLFKRYQKRINNAGIKLKRNYMRLYTIDRDE